MSRDANLHPAAVALRTAALRFAAHKPNLHSDRDRDMKGERLNRELLAAAKAYARADDGADQAAMRARRGELERPAWTAQGATDSAVPPTAPRLRMMRAARECNLHPQGPGAHRLADRLVAAGLLRHSVLGSSVVLRLTDLGKEWLARHDR